MIKGSIMKVFDKSGKELKLYDAKITMDERIAIMRSRAKNGIIKK